MSFVTLQKYAPLLKRPLGLCLRIRHFVAFPWLVHHEWTSRDRPKSAPNLTLKNSKRTSMCQENVISELWKRYIRTLKTLHANSETLYPNFENVTCELWNAISELWKRYMRTLKRFIRSLKTFEQMNKKVDHSEWTKTSRDRPKSAPYPRLKNSKKTSKCQVFVYSSRNSKIFFLKKLHTKKMDRVARRGSLPRAPGALTTMPKNWKGGPFEVFQHPFCRKTWKNWRKKFFYFREKISQCRKKLKGGTLWDFPTSILSQNIKKMQGGPFAEKKFRKKIRKKCLAVPKKNERGDSLVSPGMICYAEKQVNSFWSSSLGQMVLFDTIIFCRTFKNYFGQFVWIEKKKKKRKVTIIVAFHFMKRRLKTTQCNCQAFSLREKAPTKNNHKEEKRLIFEGRWLTESTT